ncbi:MAG: glycosyltransferase family 39 protein [Thermoplasmata archaeon]
MRKSTGFALLSIFITGLVLRLLPLLGNLYWGGDFGEYFFITRGLVENGSISLSYDGWGFTYPYFPGSIFLNGVVGFTIVSLPMAVSLTSVILASLSVFPVFMIARTLFHEDSTSLIAASVIAVSMPVVFTTSHASPGAVGDLLFATGLLLLVKAQFNPKMYYLLFPVSIALIMTHHLTTYFLIIAVLGSVFIRELISKKSDVKALRLSIIYLIFLIGSAFLYWATYAIPFRDVVMSKVLGSWVVVLGVFLIGVIGLYAIVQLRRKSEWSYRPRYPGLANRAVSLLVGLVIIYFIMSVNIYVQIPGTTITPSDWAFVFFTPLMVMFAFGAAGRGFSDYTKRGLDPTSWFITITASLFLASVFASDVIIPYRHLQYMMPASAVLVGLGLSRMAGLMGATNKKRKVVAGALITTLFVMLAFSAHPQKDLLDRLDEGVPAKLVSNAFFAGLYIDGLVASDHMASTTLFGFGGVNATWDTAHDTLLAGSFNEARAEMEGVESPSGRKRVDYVAHHRDMEKGVMLYPWNPAPVPSAEVVNKFNQAPFMKLFDNGYSKLYYVNWGLA